MVELTKDADKMAGTLYKAYLEKRNCNIPKAVAKEFRESWQAELFPNEIPQDLNDTADELCEKLNLTMDILGGMELSDELIVYMENRFPNGLAQVLDWLGKIKNAIPFA